MKHFISSLSVLCANTPPCEGRVSSRKILSLLLILFLGVGNAWAETKNDVVSAIGFAGITENGYTTAGTDYSAVANTTNNTSVTYAMQVFDGKTGAVRGNRSGNANFSCRNTTTCDGYYISKVVLTVTGGILDGATDNRSVVYFGTSAYANPTTAPTGTSTKSAENATGTTLTWNNTNEEASYFILYNLKTSGTLTGGQVTITWTKKSGGTTPDPTPIKLSAPANLKEASITETSATLSWDAVTNANNYSVTINGNTEAVTTNSYSATGLTAGTEYTWSVVAKGDGTNYTDSDAAQHTFTTTATTPDPEPGTGTSGGDKYTKVTTLDDLEDGAYYVLYGVNGSYTGALKNTVSSGKAGLQTVTITEDAITNPDAAIVWRLNGNSSDGWTLYNEKESKYIEIKTNSTSGFSLNESSSHTYTVTVSSEKGFFFKSNHTDAGSRGISIYQTDFRPYTSSAAKILYLFKKATETGGGSEEPVASLTANPTTIDFGTVYQGSTVANQTVAVNFANLTGNVTYSGLSTPFSATGNISTTGDNITISADASTIGEYSQTLTVASTADGKTAEVTVKMNVVAAPAPTGTFEKFIGTLEEGDYVLVANGTTDALKSTITDNRFDCGTVEVAEDKIVNPDKSVIWHIAANDKYWTMYNESATKYAGGTTSKNQGALLDDVTDLAKWTITVDGEGVYTFENYGRSLQSSNAGNKFLSKNSQNSYWATYASGQKNPVLYKKSDGKQPAGLTYETSKYRTKLGDSFVTPTLTNPNSLNVTYSSSNNDVAEVATDGSVTIKAVGGVEITATFAGSETHRQGSAKYTICVTEHAGTQADPYSVADARRVIDVMETAEDVYATGIVSEIVTAYNSTYGNITYNISVDGTTTGDQLQAYRGKGVNGVNFTSADDVKVGDEVVIKGTLKKYNTIYEFDENNQLVSLNRTKEQAGLSYTTTEYNVNLGDAFTAPTLNNPHSLAVTYSSNNEDVAIVAADGSVTIKTVGMVTITASFAGDATYAPGEASYTIKVMGIASLPFAFDGKCADIANTAGMSQEGIDLGDYASSPHLKINTTGDYLTIHFGSEPDKLTYDIKGNSFSGGTFTVQESADGETYTTIATYTELGDAATKEHELAAESRYVKFIYTEKVDGNVALGNISITKPDHRQEAGLAWNPTSVTLTQGEAFTAPTLNNPHSVDGITYESSNDEVATVTTAGVIALGSATGTATITATYAGDEYYKAAEVTCVITVNEYIETIDGEWQLVTDASKLQAGMEIIIASVEVDGKYYTMSKASDNGNNRTAVESTISEDKLNPAVGTTVLTLVDAGNGTFALQVDNGKYLYAASNTSNHLKETATINDNAKWSVSVTDGKASVVAQGANTHNTIRFNKSNTPKIFSCYESGQQDIALYKKMPDYTRDVRQGYYGTICLPNGGMMFGASIFEIAYKDASKIYFDEILSSEMVAGIPYIFLPSDGVDQIEVYYTDELNVSAGSKNGLVGYYDNTDDMFNVPIGNYILLNNQYCKVVGTKAYIMQNYSYIVLGDVPGSAPAPAPGVRRVSMGVTGQNTATGVDQVQGDEVPTKMIINGQLFILRGEKMYDAQGKLVK